MMSSRSILGVNMLKISDSRPMIMHDSLAAIIELYKTNQIEVCVGGVFDVEEIDKAHTLLESGKSTGKISVRWN